MNAKMIEMLLAQPTRQAQSTFLRDSHCLNPEGLAELLGHAAHMIGNNPGKARQLATLCEVFAPEAGADDLVPDATYLRAQTYSIDADFETALKLIEAAQAGYITLGNEHEAARTNIGRMFVLQELGRYAEALETGESVRTFLQNTDSLDLTHASEETNGLAARVSQNQGLCYELMGKYDQALVAYQDAEARFGLLQMTENLGDVGNNRGLVLLSLGRGHDALEAFEKALTIFDFDKDGLALKCAQTLGNIGSAHLLMGNYARGLAAFEQVRQSLESLAAQTSKHIALLDLAEAYLSLNLYDEALSVYREADALLNASGMQHDRARSLWGMGAALMAQSQFDEAARVLNVAATLFAAADNAPMRAIVLLRQSVLQATWGHSEAALSKAHDALNAVTEGDWPLQQVYAHLHLADLVLPDVDQTQFHLQACEKLMSRLNLPGLRYLLNQRLGHLKLVMGNYLDAEPLLQAAAHELDQLRAHVTEDRMRVSFATDKVAAYDDLVRLYLSRNVNGDVAHAFATAERAKSRALLALLNKTNEAKPTTDQTLQQVRRNVAQEELNATYTEMLGNAETAPRKRSLPDLQARAIELEREINRIQLQLSANRAPQDDRLDQPLSLEAIRSQLLADTALVSYYICDETIFAFVITRDHVHIAHVGQAGISTTPTVARLLQRLSAQWERFRAGRAFAMRHAAQLEQSAQRLLASLYDELFKPIEPFIQDVQRLIIVPHGLLHQVPFHALFDGSRYLIERFTISYAPSATVLAICQQRQSPASGQSLVVGVADELIPAAAAEAQAVATVLGTANVLLNEQATLAALRDCTPSCDVVHLACHGLFRAGNPMFSSLKLHDGWLLALDAMQLDLRGALVTLSACESGRSQTLSGDEIVGLMRAFLGAGVASLVVSLWLVQDETTAEFMQTWYEHMRKGMGRAEALQTAQLALKSKFAHPYYWAPFMIVGQS